MNIAIISRTFFPNLSPRSFRATELAKYFARQGHNITVYTSTGLRDYSSFERETGVRVLSMGKLHFATDRNSGYYKFGFVDKVAKHLFGYLLEYPDVELIWKTRRIVSSLKGIDLLITIAYPFTIHWGAALARQCHPKEFPHRWISDCGDPYMGNGIYPHPWYFTYVEDFWVKKTDFITIPIEEGRSAYSDRAQSKIRVIPQGFDFTSLQIPKRESNDTVIRFAYAGNVYKEYRDPTAFLDYLVSIKDRSFQFIVYTGSRLFFEPYKCILKDKLIINDFIPREQLLMELSKMDFLVNLTNNTSSQSPSKLIDYALSSRPILDVSSSFSEKPFMEEFLKRDYSHCHPKIDISMYDINQVGKLFLSLV